MSKASLELGGGNWAAKDGNILGYAVGDTSGKYLPREFDFSRGADIAATRINKNGLVEKYRENALINSGDFSIVGASGGWVKNASTVTSGYAGYDGTTNAWKLESNTGTSYNNLNQQAQYNAAITPLASKVSTFSVYLKAGTTNWARLNLNNTGYVYFDLENGEIGTVSSVWVSGQIESAGNGFYRCSITRLTGNAFDACYIYLAESDENLFPNTHSTPKHVFVQHPQLEYGLVATDYLESGGSTSKAGVLENLPRIDYTSGSAQLLMEPSRTNYIEQSEYFNAWTKQPNVTVTDNSTTSPSGFNDASKYSISASTNRALDQTTTLTSGVTYTFSMWVKAIVDTTIRVRSDASDWSEDISLLVSDGWKRIESTHTMGITDYEFGFFDVSGSTGDRFYIWGAQLEAGSYATSYIPNYGTALGVTRAAEGEDKDSLVTELPSELSGGYTLFMDFEVTGNEDPSTNYQDLFDFRFDNAVSKSAFRVETYNDSGEDSIRGFAYKQSSSSSAASVTAGDILMGSRVKLAATFDDSYGVKMFYNGSKIKDYAEVTAWEKVKFIGGAGSDGNARSRTLVNQILAYPTVLSETECENLTTI